jgi:hypothetical protein
MRTGCVAIVLALTATSTATAQNADWRFRWQQGQVLHYRVEHLTNVAEVVGGNKVETKSKVNLIKRWEVDAVDAQGTATLKMSIAAMRHEQTRPNGEVLIYDSREKDKSTPALREQMENFLGKTLAVLRIDNIGRVVEVKQGQASRYEAELPFALILPATIPAAKQTWNREYTITLDPPLGTGEKYQAAQIFTCSNLSGGLATCSVQTVLTKPPAGKQEMLPLLQKLPQGEVVFDAQRGRLHSVRLAIDQQILGHQGEGSSYRFQSTYTEQYAE